MIVFIDYLYKGIGGVAQLIVNSALELNRRGDKCKVYCSSSSYEYQRLRDTKADIIFIDSEKISLKKLSTFIDPDDVIILTHIDNSPLLEKIKNKNNRIVFYSVHPDTFFTYWKRMDKLCNQKEETLLFIRTLLSHNALYFMDGPNLAALYNKGLEHQNNISYLPVPVMSYLNIHRNFKPENETCITYLGRGDSEWKVYPVIKVIEDLNSLDAKYKLTIITDRNDLYKKMIGEYVPSNRIRIDYVNGLVGEELERYLLKYSMLHISMGTSALEGAKMGIPTILIDLSKQKFPDYYKYRWLYECVDYTLAGDIIDGKLPFDIGTSLDIKLKEISSAECYKRVSISCREYVYNNHSIDGFIDKLMIACGDSRMTTLLYCKTRFSKNMYYIRPIFMIAKKIKRIIDYINISNNK